MLTDSLPRLNERKSEYQRSDEIMRIELPSINVFRSLSAELEQALKEDDQKTVRAISKAIAKEFSHALEIPAPKISILGARPLEVTETTQMELFGDYHHDDMKIRLWMRTAVHKRATAFGTFLSTLCHELCHHHDVVGLDLPNTYHTRGFYTRAGLLYHDMRGTPAKTLVWDKRSHGRFAINWGKTMRGPR